MLGLSISKILLVILVILAVWKGARILMQLQKRMEEIGRNTAPRDREKQPEAKQAATDLVACPRCGLYVPNGTWCPSKEQCKYRK